VYVHGGPEKWFGLLPIMWVFVCKKGSQKGRDYCSTFASAALRSCDRSTPLTIAPDQRFDRVFDEMFPVDDYFRIPGAYIVITFQQLHACGQVEPFEIGAD